MGGRVVHSTWVWVNQARDFEDIGRKLLKQIPTTKILYRKENFKSIETNDFPFTLKTAMLFIQPVIFSVSHIFRDFHRIHLDKIPREGRQAVGNWHNVSLFNSGNIMLRLSTVSNKGSTGKHRVRTQAYAQGACCAYRAYCAYPLRTHTIHACVRILYTHAYARAYFF